MSEWYRVSQNGAEVRVEFTPSKDRFWPPEIIRTSALSVAGVSGRPVVLTGPGAVWMYAHAAATLRAAGAGHVGVQTPNRPGTADDTTGSESLLILAGEDRQKGALLLVRLRASPPLSPTAVNRLLEPRLEELARLRPEELVIAGRASVEVYARIARAAVDSGARRIVCWSARDGLVVVYDPAGGQLGSQIARPDWLAQAMPRPIWPVILGVTGDPNCGKSVFSAALDCYREQIGCDGWKLDCDGQSPTPPWYLSLIGDERAKELRDQQKRCWTPVMEATIAEQLRLGRELFSVLIADLPGGNHKAVPPQRLPEGRERIFAEVDALILLERDDAPSEAAWREVLRPHGLDGRLAAVLRSRYPDTPPSLSVRKEGGLWRGNVTGLDRSRSARELAEAYQSGLKQLWPALRDFARGRSARG
jgi:hypothetical protein